MSSKDGNLGHRHAPGSGVTSPFHPGAPPHQESAMSQNRKPVALAIGATLAGGLALSGSTFASTQLAQGYLLGAQDAGAAATDTSEKAKEGGCGAAAMDSDKDG